MTPEKSCFFKRPEPDEQWDAHPNGFGEKGESSGWHAVPTSMETI